MEKGRERKRGEKKEGGRVVGRKGQRAKSKNAEGVTAVC